MIAEHLSLNSHDVINNQQGTLSAKDLKLNATSLDNSQGHILHTGTDQLDLNFSQSLNNQSGEIRSNAAQVNLNTTSLNNTAGQLIHAGTGQLDIQVDQLQGNQGKILSNGQLQLQAGILDLSQGVTSAEHIILKANQLNHQQGQLIQRGKQSPLTLAIQQQLNNQLGFIQSQTILNMDTGALNNQGGTLSTAQGQDLNLKVKALLDNSHSGKIYVGNNANIQAGSIDNHTQGQINVQQNLKLNSQLQVNNQTGQIAANADVQIQSQGIDNSQGQISSVQGRLDLDAGTGLLSNQSGSLQSAKDIEIKAERLHSQSGLINAQGSIQAQIQQEIDNNAGQIIANQSVQLNSQGLNNNAGQIGSVESTLKVDAGQGIISNQQGKLQSKQDLSVKAQGIDNQSGLIATQENLVLEQHWLNNHKGQVISGESLNLTGQDFNNQGGLLQSGRDLSFKLIGKLDNSQSGQLISGGDTQIEAQQLENSQQGLINAQGSLSIRTQQDVNNNAGIIAANKFVEIQSQGLDNSQGQLGSVKEQVTISTGKGALLNQSGTLQSTGDLNVQSTGLNNNKGTLNSLGKVSLVSDGDLSNDGGQIASNGQLEITANDLSNQTGLIQTGEESNLSLKLGGALSNQTGQIHSGADQQITAQSVDNSAQGQITAQGQLNIQSQAEINNQMGKLIANGLLQVKGEGLNNTQGQIGSLQDQVIVQSGQGALTNQSGTIQAKKDLSVTAQSVDNQSGQMNSQGQLQLNSQQAINNLEGLIAADLGLKLNSQGLNNNRGQIGSAQGDVDLNAGSGLLSNQAGVVLSGKALTLNAGQVDNSNKGQINSQADLAISTVKEINNQSGVIASNQQLSLKSQGLNNNAGQIGSIHAGVVVDSGSGAIDNNSGVIQAQNDIQLKAQELNSHLGKISSEKSIELSIDQGIDNSAGQIVANDAVTIQSHGLNNDQGQIASIKEHLTIDAGTGLLSNQSGSLQSAKDIAIKAERLHSQSGLINAQGSIQAQIQQEIDNNAGQIIANQSVQLNSQGLNNNAGQIGSVESTLKVDAGQGIISNQQGKLQSKQDLSVKAQGIDNQSGLIATQENLVLEQHWLNNHKGQVISGESLNLTGQDFNNQGGLLQSGRDLSFKLIGKLDNSQSGQLISGGDTQIDAQQLENSQQGLINAQGSLSIRTQQDVNNNAGIIAANKFVEIQSQGLDNSQGQLGSVKEQVTISTGKGALLNQSGTLQSTGDLNVQSAGLNNNKGTLNSLGKVSLVSDGDLSNDGGQIASNGQLEITANDLSNQTGLIQTGEESNLSLKLGGALSNQTGQIHSGADQQITAQSVDNSAQGQITAQGQLNIQSQAEINNQMGKLIANGLLQVKGEGLNNTQGQMGSLQDQVIVQAGQGALTNQSGTIQAKKDLSVTAQSIDNQSGQMNSQGQLQLNSQQAINNLEGLIAADLGLKLNSQGLNNNRGQIGSAQGDVDLNAGNGLLSNQAGVVLSGKALTLNAGQVDNSNKGQINSQADLAISTVKEINNQSGVIASNQQLSLKSQGLNNNAGQIGSVQGQIQLDAGQLRLENQQGLIQAGQGINIVANGVNNAQGQINSKNLLQLNSQGQLLDNSQGTLSSESIKIDSGRLNNNQGLIQAQQTIQIDTHNQDLVNTNSGQQGGILSQGDIQLSNVKTLNNSQGYLASAKELGIQVNQVLNQQGTILAGKQLNIWGTGQNQLLDNQSGQLLSMGGMTLNIDRINNNGKLKPSDADSHIMAVGDLNITTQQLDNQNTLTTSPTDTSIQGIDANNLNITTNILNNQTGAIRSSGNQNLNIRQILNNQSGQISSEKQLIIVGDQLEINNLKGQILSGTGLNLTAKSLSGDGKVLSLGDAQVNLKESYTHSVGAQLQANQNLSLITQGNVINYGTINSGNRLDINAVNIGNMVDAKIESHETRLTAQNELNNTGLINGDYTRLQANTLNNQGTGRIYGTTLAINANTLNNQPNSAGVAPVIASRGDMHLGVQVLNNLANTADYASQSLIFSAGNLYLGGGLDANDKTVGQALVINNESATIESLGNMRLSAKQINNINKNFEVADTEVNRKERQEVKEYPLSSTNVLRLTTKYSEIYSKTEAVSSTPAKIIAGGNMDLGNAIGINDKSWILAGGALYNDGSIKNIGASGTEKVLIKETQSSWDSRYPNSHQIVSKSEDTKILSTFDLGVSQKDGNQKLNQNQISITTLSQNQSNDKAQSSQIQQTNLNGLKDTNNSTQVEQAQNSQGENLTVKQAENISNSIQSQTGQKNQPLLQSKDLDANVSGSQVTVSKVEHANAQNLTTGQASDITNSIQTQKGQGAQASLQSKDLDASASGVNVNILQAEQVNGKNLTTGHSADLSNTTQTQTDQLNQPSQQSKDLNANLLDENVSLSKAGQVNDRNQQLNDTKQVNNSSQLNDLQKNSSSLQSKDLNLSVGQTSQKQGDAAGQAQANNFTQQANAPSEADESTQYEIRTLQSTEIKVPNSALYRVNANSKAGYLVETDPSFTNYKTWLSSDYMLDALGLDPALQQKRLADGLYEQRLVQDQIANLTGYRFLEGYANDDEQYKALMNNGVSFAKLYGLRPGIALTAAQTAQLTSDIVWLVEQTVILPNGTKTQALVPQVYVKARVGDLKGDGTLVSANSINFKLDGDLINGATIAGRQAVQITADNVQNLNGRIQGNQVTIETKNDLNNVGGQIQAKDSMALKVGGDFNLISTLNNSDVNLYKYKSQSTSIDRVAGLYVGDSKSSTNNPTLVIDVAGNTLLKAAEIKNNNGATILNITGNIDIGAVSTSSQEKWITNSKNSKQLSEQKDIGSKINSAGSIVISAQNISGKAVNLTSQVGNIELSAQKDIVLENGIDQNSISIKSASKGSFGSKKSSTYDENTTTSIANQLNAGKNIILNSQQGNITATHLQAGAGDSIQIQALQGNVNLLSTINEKSVSETSSKSNFATYNNRQKGYIDQEVAQTQLVAGKNIDINAAKNIELQANDITAGQSIFVGNTLMQRQVDGTLKSADGSLMPENVKLTTLETQDQQWDEQQKGYRGVVKELMKVTEVGLAGVQSLLPGVKVDTKLTVGESNSKREEQIKQTGTNLTANNVYVGSSGQTTLTSADITAKNTILSGQKVTLNAAEEQNISVTSHSKETIEGLGVKLNKDSVRLGGFVSEDTTQSTKTTEITHKAGSIQTENLKIQGAEGVDILGQNIKATGDTVIDHGRGDLNIGGYENKTTIEDKTHKETISTEVGVRNAYLDAALALGAVKDAAEAVKQAKDQYSQAQRDYASGKINKEALEDTKANVAMATANLANAQIGAAAAAATAAAAASTSYGTGFTIGANGERIENTTTTNTTQGKWQGSQLELNKLTLKSENQDVNVQGSRLTATGLTTFDGTKDLNVSAGKEQSQQDTSSKTNNQSVSYTYGGGGSASVGKQTSKSHNESLTNVNSTVDLNTVSGSLNKLNIQGGEVSIADRGDIKVNQIHVESLQDTASGNSSSKGGSVGVGIGSGGGNVTASYNQAKGQNDKAWVNETSKLLIGNAQNDADLDAMGVQKLTNIGGVIANANKNVDGTLTDHGKLNYTGALELKDLQDHSSESNRGFNVSTSVGKSIKGESKESSLHPSGSTTVGLQSTGNEKEQLTKATMGQGSVTNTTTTSNRDINNTQEITQDQVTGLLNGSVTVDNRLLTESGRAQIIQEQKDLPENFRQSAENIVKALPDGASKDKALQSLNNIQSKLVKMPPELQALGGDMIQAFPEFIKQGGEPKDFEILVSQPEILASLQDVYKLRDEIANYKRDLIAQGYSSDQVKELLIEKMINSKQTNFTSAKQVDAQGLVEFTQQPPTIEPVSTIIPLAGADTAEAEFGKDKISVSNESNVGIDIFTKVGQVKQKIDKKVEATGIDPQKASLALGLVLGGPVNLAKSVVTDYLYGDKVAELNERVVDEITAFIFNTDYDQIQSIKNAKNQSSNETAKQLVGQQELTADGINLTTSVVLGASAAVGIGKGIAKGKESESSSTALANREELSKPYDSLQTRNDLEVVHGAENVKSTTVINKPYQRVNSNTDKGIEVVYDSYGNKAVKTKYKDPSTNEVKTANIAYDSRGLPVFDNYAKYTTKIDKPKGYESMSDGTRRTKEMELATLDLKKQIESGRVDKNQFTKDQLSDISAGSDKIKGYTWHHNAQSGPNNFQLIPEDIHKSVSHIGEASLSGGK
ncbi:hemagglutinin repeat-containing protein [Acinetobacter sp. ULE_I046]|uniref:hemagglutinin repeat-containing protein n=1 Tax=unclassified Acinetobacter TaxID=196816 RepID=UPI003AF8473C